MRRFPLNVGSVGVWSLVSFCVLVQAFLPLPLRPPALLRSMQFGCHTALRPACHKLFDPRSKLGVPGILRTPFKSRTSLPILKLRGSNSDAGDQGLQKGEFARVKSNAREQMMGKGWQEDVMNVTIGRIGQVSGTLMAQGGLYMIDFSETEGLEYLGTKVFMRSCIEKVPSAEVAEMMTKQRGVSPADDDETRKAAAKETTVKNTPTPDALPLRTVVKDLEIEIARCRTNLDSALARMREEALTRRLTWEQIMQTQYGNEVRAVEDLLESLEKQLDDLLDSGTTEGYQRVGFPQRPAATRDTTPPPQPDARALAEAFVRGRAARKQEENRTSVQSVSEEERAQRDATSYPDEEEVADALGPEASMAELLRKLAMDLGEKFEDQGKEGDGDDESWAWFDADDEREAGGMQSASTESESDGGWAWGEEGEVVDAVAKEVTDEDDEQEAQAGRDKQNTVSDKDDAVGAVVDGGIMPGSETLTEDSRGGEEKEAPSDSREPDRQQAVDVPPGSSREGGPNQNWRRGSGFGPAYDRWEASMVGRTPQSFQEGMGWEGDGWGAYADDPDEEDDLDGGQPFGHNLEEDSSDSEMDSMDELEAAWAERLTADGGGFWTTIDDIRNAQAPAPRSSRPTDVSPADEDDDSDAGEPSVEDEESGEVPKRRLAGDDLARNPNVVFPDGGNEFGMYMINETHGVPIMSRSAGFDNQIGRVQEKAKMTRGHAWGAGGGADYMIIPRPFYSPAMDPEVSETAKALAGPTGVFKCNDTQPSRYDRLWMQKGQRLRDEWLERHPPPTEPEEPPEYEGSIKYPPGKKWMYNGAPLKKQRWVDENASWVELDEDEDVLYSREYQGTTYIIPRDDDAWGYAWYPDGYEDPGMDISHLPPYRQQLIKDFSHGVDELTGLSKVDVEFQEQLLNTLQHSAGKDNETEAFEQWLRFMFGMSISDLPPRIDDVRSGAAQDPNFADRCCGFDAMQTTLLNHSCTREAVTDMRGAGAGCQCRFEELRDEIEAGGVMDTSDDAGFTEETLWYLRRVNLVGYVHNLTSRDTPWSGRGYLEYALCHVYNVNLHLHSWTTQDGWTVDTFVPPDSRPSANDMFMPEAADGDLHMCLCGNHFWEAPKTADLWAENACIEWENSTAVTPDEYEAMSAEEKKEVLEWDRFADPDVKMLFEDEVEELPDQGLTDVTTTFDMNPEAEYDPYWLAEWNRTFWEGIQNGNVDQINWDEEMGVPQEWITNFDWEGWEKFVQDKDAEGVGRFNAEMMNATEKVLAYDKRQGRILDMMELYFSASNNFSTATEDQNAVMRDNIAKARTRLKEKVTSLLSAGEEEEEEEAGTEDRDGSSKPRDGDQTVSGREEAKGAEAEGGGADAGAEPRKSRSVLDDEEWADLKSAVEAEGLYFFKQDLRTDEEKRRDEENT